MADFFDAGRESAQCRGNPWRVATKGTLCPLLSWLTLRLCVKSVLFGRSTVSALPLVYHLRSPARLSDGQVGEGVTTMWPIAYST